MVAGVTSREVEANVNRIRTEAGFAADASYIAAVLSDGTIFQRNRILCGVSSTRNALNLANDVIANDNIVIAPLALRAVNASGGSSGIFFVNNFTKGTVNNAGGGPTHSLRTLYFPDVSIRRNWGD